MGPRRKLLKVANPRRSDHCFGGNSLTVAKKRFECLAIVCELGDEVLSRNNAFVVLEPGGVVEKDPNRYWVDLVERNPLLLEKRLKGVYASRIEMPIGS